MDIERDRTDLSALPSLIGSPAPTGRVATRLGLRRRDRRGRGLRGDLIPPHLPGYLTRRERFDTLVTDIVSGIVERFPRQLAHLRVLVEEVPHADPASWDDALVTLGRTAPGTRDQPPTVIIYRRPIETRCSQAEERELIVRQVLSEQIGSLLGLQPEQVDPSAW